MSDLHMSSNGTLSNADLSSCEISSSTLEAVCALATENCLSYTSVIQAACAVLNAVLSCTDTAVHAEAILSHESSQVVDQSITSQLHTINVCPTDNFNALLASFTRAPTPAEQYSVPDAVICHCGDTRLSSDGGIPQLGHCRVLIDKFRCDILICIYAIPVIRVYVVHKASRISSKNAFSIASSLEKILIEVSAHPKMLVGTVDCVGDQDRSLIELWNKDVAELYPDCLHTSISAFAIANGDAPAVCATDGDLSRSELDDLSSRLAATLISHGVKPGTVVPVCFEKSKFVVVAMLAIFKAGAACTTFEPSLPTDRLETMIEKLEAHLILVQRSQRERFSSGIKAIPLENWFALDACPTVRCSNFDRAMILFTSGSSGSPKGIIHEHGSIHTSLRLLASSLGLDEDSRIAHFAAYSFDLSMIEILLPLMVGGCVCIPSENHRNNDLAGCLESMHVNMAMLTPSSIKLLQPDLVPSMRKIMVGGEPITGELISTWKNHVLLINAWGTSECGICSHTNVQSEIPASIGSCLGMGQWIVDPAESDRLLPVGAIGELIVEGHQIAREYLKQPKKTAASFLKATAWAAVPRGRLYRTGDLMRYLPNGSMEYCGRKDTQVKVRGCRIELGEIEYHITADKRVNSAAAAVPKQGPYKGQLVAIIQPEGHGNNEPCTQQLQNTSNPSILSFGPYYDNFSDFVAALNQTLRRILLFQAVPQQFIFVSELPRSKSDKVDRKALGKWLDGLEFTRDTTERQPEAQNSHDPTIRQVGRCVASVSSHADMSLRGDLKQDTLLKDCGIDSLSAVMLRNVFHQSMGVQVSVKTLLDQSLSIFSLAAKISGYQEASILKRQIVRSFDEEKPDEGNIALSELEKLHKQIIGTFRPVVQIHDVVFLTGATGYVGSHILFALLQQPRVKKVIVLLRGKTQEAALERLIRSARVGKWWRPEFISKLDVWVGDMNMPRLGLQNHHWQILTSSAEPDPEQRAINVIVHAGAKVHWLMGYEELKAANVTATFDLLAAFANARMRCKFIFVSSDPEQTFNFKSMTGGHLPLGFAKLNGYRQSKAVSEMLVRAASDAENVAHRSISIIKPGFVVGSLQHGVPNEDDFFWRLCKAVVHLSAYDVEELGWIYLASVDEVSGRVIARISDSVEDDELVTTGIRTQDLWETLAAFSGKKLHPLNHADWVEKLQYDVLAIGHIHPLWSLLHLIRDEGLKLAAICPPAHSDRGKSRTAIKAIVKGLDHLAATGSLHVNGLRNEGNAEVFNRKGMDRHRK